MYKINSLVFKWICFCLLVPFCLSCTDKAPEYPDLEGYWKQEWIEDEATDGQSECNRLFWAFQLGVSEIRDLGGNRPQGGFNRGPRPAAPAAPKEGGNN